ncbi:MAG: hypothetical protein LBU82_05250, partial [Treponema sp.]|nr:hypothetical protein [Treponema sp.]
RPPSFNAARRPSPAKRLSALPSLPFPNARQPDSEDPPQRALHNQTVRQVAKYLRPSRPPRAAAPTLRRKF